MNKANVSAKITISFHGTKRCGKGIADALAQQKVRGSISWNNSFLLQVHVSIKAMESFVSCLLKSEAFPFCVHLRTGARKLMCVLWLLHTHRYGTYGMNPFGGAHMALGQALPEVPSLQTTCSIQIAPFPTKPDYRTA